WKILANRLSQPRRMLKKGYQVGPKGPKTHPHRRNRHLPNQLNQKPNAHQASEEQAPRLLLRPRQMVSSDLDFEFQAQAPLRPRIHRLLRARTDAMHHDARLPAIQADHEQPSDTWDRRLPYLQLAPNFQPPLSQIQTHCDSPRSPTQKSQNTSPAA